MYASTDSDASERFRSSVDVTTPGVVIERTSTLTPAKSSETNETLLSFVSVSKTNVASREEVCAKTAPVAPSTTTADAHFFAFGTRQSVRKSSRVRDDAVFFLSILAPSVVATAFPVAVPDGAPAVTATRKRTGTARSADDGGGGRRHRRDALGPSAKATDHTLDSSPR